MLEIKSGLMSRLQNLKSCLSEKEQNVEKMEFICNK